jgi:hypothetical protein
MPVRIGYYVHHQGKGHLARALAIARAAPGHFTLLGTGLAGGADEVPVLDLPPDLPDEATRFDETTQPRSLHYAPLRNAGVRARMAAVAGWIAAARPGLLVCDVSVEIAMLARLLSTPTVYVRLNGARDDAAHVEAFRSAQALLAPFHADLEDPHTPDWVRAKTHYVPGIVAPAPAGVAVANRILVVSGAGGAPLDGDELAAAARATPGWAWRAIGPVSPARRPADNLTIAGWVEDAAAEIAAAAIVIGGAGDGLVAGVIAAGRPFVCLPQPRPYGEQQAKAERLAAPGAAIVLPAWPPAVAWPAIFRRAQALDPARLAALHDPAGARHAAAFLLAQAARF